MPVMGGNTPKAPATEEAAPSRPARARPIGVSVDEMSEWSFPASDPPAVWTWDPPERERSEQARDEG